MVRLLLIELWKYQDCGRHATTKNCYNVFFFILRCLCSSPSGILIFFGMTLHFVNLNLDIMSYDSPINASGYIVVCRDRNPVVVVGV